jgi:hypothetical protein
VVAGRMKLAFVRTAGIYAQSGGNSAFQTSAHTSNFKIYARYEILIILVLNFASLLQCGDAHLQKGLKMEASTMAYKNYVGPGNQRKEL